MTLGVAEDFMGADPAPDDMRFAEPLLTAIGEGGPPVRGPGHLEDSDGGLDTLDPQGRTASAVCKVGHEVIADDALEPRPRISCQLLPVGSNATLSGRSAPDGPLVSLVVLGARLMPPKA